MWTTPVIEATNEIAESFKSGRLRLLTESDLKTNLSSKIKSKLADNITVNTESPWYDTYENSGNYFIDITAFDNNKLQITYDPTNNRKGYKYEDEALAIELKYFRYKEDIEKIAEDFAKIRLLIKAPKNDCFIIAAARTKELFDTANDFMHSQLNKYKVDYANRAKVFLFGPNEIIEIK